MLHRRLVPFVLVLVLAAPGAIGWSGKGSTEPSTTYDRDATVMFQQPDAAPPSAGVNRVYLSGIERGIRNLTVLHLERIARALKVAPGSLLDN